MTHDLTLHVVNVKHVIFNATIRTIFLMEIHVLTFGFPPTRKCS